MLSFIVPAYNEEKSLAATLAAIHRAAQATGERYEIVVANDGSTDATVAIAQEAGAQVVTVAHRQISKTRNSGARASTGDRLIFVDADTLVDAAVVRAALEALRAGAVGGGAEVRFRDGPRWVHIGAVLVIPYFRVMHWAAGCFVFCTRDAFERAGGFSEEYFAAEELHFSQAMKRLGRFVILRAAVRTSARKAEGRTGWEVMRLVARMILRNPLGIKRREEAAFWYDGRR